MSSKMHSRLSDNSTQSNWQSRPRSGGNYSTTSSYKPSQPFGGGLRLGAVQLANGTPQMANQVAPGSYYGPVDRAHSSSKQRSSGSHATQASSGQPTLRQQQQNVEQVSVPDASKFFVLDVTTRQSILSKLNLNSLTEYIEHLEQYRMANRDKIVRFNQMYYSVVKCNMMRDPDKDVNDQDLTDPLMRLTGQVTTLMKSIEAKLEACQLSRVMNSGLEMFPLPESTAARVQTNDHDQLVEKIEVEVIDLTTGGQDTVSKPVKPDGGECNQSECVTGPESAPQEEDKPDAQLNDDEEEDSICITTASFPLASCDVRKGLIDELQDKLHQLELVASQASQTSCVIEQATYLATGTGTSITAQSQASAVSASLDTKGKLLLSGHELPLPQHYNELSQTEKNLLICQLPEMVRGQYLNLCWESRFVEQLTKAPIDVRQMLTSLNL